MIQLPFSAFCKHSSNVSIHPFSFFFFFFWNESINRAILVSFCLFSPPFSLPSFLSTFYPFSMALGTGERRRERGDERKDEGDMIGILGYMKEGHGEI